MRPGVCARGRRSRLRLRAVSRAPPQQYRRGVSGRSLPEWSQTEQVRVLIPVFAVGTAIIAAVADPSSGAELILCGLAAAPFLVWTYVPGVPLLGAVACGDRPGGRGAAVGAARAAPVRGLPARVRDRAIRLVARRIRGVGPAGAARPRGRERDPGSVRDLDVGSGSSASPSRGSSAARPRARPSSSPSSRPPGASSRSRRCWSSGAGSPATSTTSWATGWPP